MPTYHLHLINTHIEADDVVGHELPDLDAARTLALAGIRDFLGHEAFNGILDFRGHVQIEDNEGAVLQLIRFADAFTIKGL